MTPTPIEVHRAALVAILQEESGITLDEAPKIMAHFDQAVLAADKQGYDRAHRLAIACACNGLIGSEG